MNRIVPLTLLGLLLVLGEARGQSATSTAAVTTSTVSPSAVGFAEERVTIGEPLTPNEEGEYERVDAVDVDGRREKKPTVGESLLWVPRVVFSPVYFTFEFIIRRPVGWFLTNAERNNWSAFVIDFFTFGEERNVGVVPTAFIDFNFRPSIGVLVFANDAWVKGHSIRAQFGFGGSRWWRAGLSDRWQLTDDLRLDLGFTFSLRPDNIFHGLGPDSLFDNRSRYEQRRIIGSVGLRQNILDLGEVLFQSNIEESQFDTVNTAFQDDDPSIDQAVQLGFYEEPAGLDGYFILKNRLDARIDSRRNTRENGTGVGARGIVSYNFDLNDRERREWFFLGAGLAGHLDIGKDRILSLAGYAGNVFQTGRDEVPFTELPTSGQTALILGGFLPGRLIGNSIAGAAFEYRYDIWATIDGNAFWSVGNVFGPEFDQFAFEKLRMSYGFGLSTTDDPDASFQVLFAFGHETFEQNSTFDTFRFVLGYAPNF